MGGSRPRAKFLSLRDGWEKSEKSEAVNGWCTVRGRKTAGVAKAKLKKDEGMGVAVGMANRRRMNDKSGGLTRV